MESDQKRIGKSLKIFLFGSGKMGKKIKELAPHQGHQIVDNFFEADIGIDFSHSDVLLDHVEAAIKAEKNLVIGTTGWEAQTAEIRHLVKQAQIGVLYSPNFSIGVALFLNIVKQAAKLLAGTGYEVSGLEAHHSQKMDAPSGTAKLLTEVLRKEMDLETSFCSLRCGHIPGTHTLLFDSPCDTITLTHAARNRDGFALGALSAAEWLLGRKGFYTLEDMLKNSH
jgi:4-hydroxy-tetrahydrodipicolinate reductase